ncbi:MAG TPA: ATP-binding protein [Gemmatimonadales bacterium]|nr:ATP-binding protein [Gemmatimonadales bacterium]
MDSKALTDSLDVGVAIIAPDWTILQWSPAAARVTGLSAEQVVGKTLWAAFPMALGTHVDRALHGVQADGQPRSYVAPAEGPAQGTFFEARVTEGPLRQLILVLRPLQDELPRESRAAQMVTAFEEERRLYAQLFGLLPIPALVLTVDGAILDANPEARTLLGAPDRRTLRGRPLAAWAPARERPALADALRAAVRTRQRFRMTVDFAGESVREVDALIENLDPERGASKLLFLALDTSREVLLQRKLLEADRLSQLGTLVSGVAHELNNPLAAIAAFAEVVRAAPVPPDVREAGEVIQAEALRAGRVVQTLLDFARQRPRARQPVDIKDVVARVVALHRSALKRARVQAVDTIPSDVPAVLGDPQELQQVFLNALVNGEQAIAATGRPGKVVFSSRRVDDRLVLSVEDTGPGVPPEILDRVFEPFFTTKGEGGTGLGLAISSGLVKGMGGRMYITNVEGGGAGVAIELPVDTAPAADRPDPEAGAAAPARPLSVLLIEDEETVRRGIGRMAERLGHRVTAATGFTEAVALLRNPDERYDALIVDVHLEDAHSGFDVFETLRLEGQGRERRLVFTTGDSISPTTRDLLQLAERPVLKKPFSLDELRDILARL